LQTINKSTDHEIISHTSLEQQTEVASPSSVAPEMIRQCIVTRENAAKDDMLRFVLAPDNTVTFDIDSKLPGRGLYVSADKAHLNEAISKNLFSRAAKTKAVIPDDFVNRITTILRQKIFNTLCLTNRAGQIGAGADQCLDILRKGQAGLYVTSATHPSEMRERIEIKNPDLPLIDYFNEEELGQIIARPKLTHIIVKQGKLCFKGVRLHQIYKQLK
jgi:hypothetical protein